MPTKKELIAEAESMGLTVDPNANKAVIEAAIADATPSRPDSAAGTGTSSTESAKAAAKLKDAPPLEPASYAGKYRIIHTVSIDGRRLGIGTVHHLSDLQAKPLVKGRHVQLLTS